MQVINEATALEMIENSGGKIFGLTFIKRSNGRQREMTARKGVKQGVTGEGQPFDVKAAGLTTVCEFTADHGWQFRNVPVEGIVSIRMQGVTFLVHR